MGALSLIALSGKKGPFGLKSMVLVKSALVRLLLEKVPRSARSRMVGIVHRILHSVILLKTC